MPDTIIIAKIETTEIEAIIAETILETNVSITAAHGHTGAGFIIGGTVTGDIIRYNSVSGGWEVKAEPLAFKQIVLTPAEAAILDAEGGMWYKSTDKSVYVCTNV